MTLNLLMKNGKIQITAADITVKPKNQHLETRKPDIDN